MEGTDLNLSPLLVGLLQTRYEVSESDLNAATVALLQRNPVESALEVEAILKRMAIESEDRRVLEHYAKFHPHPIDAILAMFQTSRQLRPFDVDIQKQLLVRLVVEADLNKDPEGDSKLAYAAHAFSVLEIPEEKWRCAMSIFFKRLRNTKSQVVFSSLVDNKTWPTNEARTYDASSKTTFWTAARLEVKTRECIVSRQLVQLQQSRAN